jgi:hypothetical protein
MINSLTLPSLSFIQAKKIFNITYYLAYLGFFGSFSFAFINSINHKNKNIRNAFSFQAAGSLMAIISYIIMNKKNLKNLLYFRYGEWSLSIGIYILAMIYLMTYLNNQDHPNYKPFSLIIIFSFLLVVLSALKKTLPLNSMQFLSIIIALMGSLFYTIYNNYVKNKPINVKFLFIFLMFGLILFSAGYKLKYISFNILLNILDLLYRSGFTFILWLSSL